MLIPCKTQKLTKIGSLLVIFSKYSQISHAISYYNPIHCNAYNDFKYAVCAQLMFEQL